MNDTPSKSPAPKGVRRLVITEMVLENFKSYAGVQRVGPFHKSFSAVVGPNGSGKSNVIDAMLFVFGKRAQQLRLKKVSELIHNSAAAPNLTYAKVSVHFVEIIDKGGEDVEEVPNTTFEVSRVAYSDNKSSYYVDGRPSSFGEVTELLKGKGIDLDNNRFLILQGEVEQISMMKPKGQDKNDTGLLEYLEDIIGTNTYVESIEEMGAALDKLDEDRQSILQRVKAAEGEVAGLEGAKAEAEAYMAKDRQLKWWKCAEAQVCLGMAQKTVEEYEAKAREIEARRQEEEEKNREAMEASKEAEERFNAIKKEYDAIEAEVQKVEDEFKKFETRDVKVREDLKHHKAAVKKLKEKHDKARERLRKATDSMEEAVEEKPKLDRRVAEIVKQLEREEAKVEIMWNEVKDEVEVHTVRLQEAKAALIPWDEKLTKARAERDVIAAERDQLLKRAAEAERALECAKQGIEAAEREAEEKAAACKAMEAEEETLRVSVKDAEKRAAEAEKAETEACKALESIQGVLEEKRTVAREVGSRGRVFQALENAKTKGKIKGIRGRLGDLGSIDAKYDVAVSQACGALDFVVVEDTKAAQECVDYVRKHSLGVVSCLILDRQRHFEKVSREPVQTPEGVPRLFDLVNADDDLRTAFYFALRDTVVAKDLDQASRIAYGPDKRFRRVVTLGGELIVESGAVSGGGQGPPKSGRMKIGSRAPTMEDPAALEEEVRVAERSAEEAKLVAAQAREEAIAAKKEAKEAAQRLRDIVKQLPKIRMDVQALSAKADTLRSQLDALAQDVAAAAGDGPRMRELESEVAKHDKKIAKIEGECAGLREAVEAVKQELDEAGGASFRRQKDLVERLREDLESTRKRAIKCDVQAQAHKKGVAKAEKEVEEVVKEMEEADAKEKEMKQMLKTMEDDAFEVVKRFEEVKALQQEQHAELEAIRAEHTEHLKQRKAIEEARNNLKRLFGEVEKAVKEETKRAVFWKKQLDKAMQDRTELAEPGEAAPGPLSEEELAAIPVGDDGEVLSTIKYEITILESAMAEMQPDMGAIDEYRRKVADFKSRAEELEQSTAKRDEMRKEHEALKKRRLDEFMAGFRVIALKLKEMYQMITLGGDAELELVDSLDPFSDGIVFSVRPPRKSWKNIANLSGGEKTLSSLALVFALHHYKPTPLYVMDEIDAALDFRNVSIVGHYIKERTKDAQFVIISLRNNMFELADRLVGIYKTHNQTKSVTINPSAFTFRPGGTQGQRERVGATAATPVPVA